MDESFLTGGKVAQRLYDSVAAAPIIDYHSHVSAADLAADRRFPDLTELWVAHDPYKHRTMRIAGVPEALITGAAASPRERFDAWAATVPQTAGNPLWLWTALELKRVFNIDEPLTPQSAECVWDAANALLRTPEFSARRLLERFHVACICTSDGLLDELSAHQTLAGAHACGDMQAQVLPSLRGDDIVACEPEWVARLAATTHVDIESFESFCAAVRCRLNAFDSAGCRLADQALDVVEYVAADETTIERLFRLKLAGERLSAVDAARLRTAVLRFLGREYGRRGWIMQLHLGAQRHTSTRLRKLAGAAGGYAVPRCECNVTDLCAFLDDLECAGVLPRTILYSLNPADNAALATLTGAFAEDGVAGKIQFGPAWWYNDHAWGIRQHLEALANHGLLAMFIGMTTDSRSLLSMARHETFRRVLCGTLEAWACQGLVPNNEDALLALAERVCWKNAANMLKGAGLTS